MDISIIKPECSFKFRVAGIFIHNNKLLVTKRGDIFCLPGGYVSLGENSYNAVKREIYEETGLEFNILGFRGVIENFYNEVSGRRMHGIEFYYNIDLLNSEDINKLDYNRIENDGGHIIQHEFLWLDIEKLGEYNLVPSCLKESICKNKDIFHYIEEEEV